MDDDTKMNGNIISNGGRVCIYFPLNYVIIERMRSLMSIHSYKMCADVVVIEQKKKTKNVFRL